MLNKLGTGLVAGTQGGTRGSRLLPARTDALQFPHVSLFQRAPAASLCSWTQGHFWLVHQGLGMEVVTVCPCR